MIVDDGSKDNTADIVKEYEQNFPGVFRLISKENGKGDKLILLSVQFLPMKPTNVEGE